MFGMDLWTLYIGGLIASWAMLGMVIVWTTKLELVGMIILCFFSIFWPIGWPFAFILGFTKLNTATRPKQVDRD